MRRSISTALLGALVWLAGSPSASACETEGLPLGLAIRGPFPASVPQGGVLAISATALAASVDTAMTDLTEFRVLRGEDEVPGALEVVTIASGTGPRALQLHELVLVWRPQQPFVAGDALVLHYRYGDGGLDQEGTLPFTVDDRPTAIALPEVTPAARVAQADPSDRVCCELPADSCDFTTLCLPTRAREVAAIDLQRPRLTGVSPQGYLWAARVDAQGGIGPPLPRAYSTGGEELPRWAEWPDLIVFPEADAAAPYCVVLGATSFLDEQSIVSGPLCVTAEQIGELGEVELEPDLKLEALERARACISEPVYEADGSPYPPREAQGCRTAPRAGPPLLLLLALLRRRRGA